MLSNTRIDMLTRAELEYYSRVPDELHRLNNNLEELIKLVSNKREGDGSKKG
jgi:hypothetical protein